MAQPGPNHGPVWGYQVCQAELGAAVRLQAFFSNL